MVQQRADLHVHTAASDGILTPTQVVEEASRIGLAAVGITDHDTVSGILPALSRGRELGVIVVPGIEINTDFERQEVHMLGYFIDYESESLKSKLEGLRAAREERAEQIVARLKQLGMKVSIERVRQIAGSAPIARPHIARAMVEAGYASSTDGAFGKYLKRGAPAHVPRYKLTPFEAIDIIRGAGGVPVMAHPGNSRLDELIPEFVKGGMLGIEAAHNDHSTAQRGHYMKIAQTFGLIATGGSDFHGADRLKMSQLGRVTVDLAVVDRLYLARTA